MTDVKLDFVGADQRLGLSAAKRAETAAAAAEASRGASVAASGYTNDAIEAALPAGRNLFDPARAVAGYYVGSTGELVASISSFSSDFIPIDPNEQFVANQQVEAAGARYIAFYDAARVLVTTIHTTYAPGAPITAPANAAIRYVRLTFLTPGFGVANPATLMVNRGAVALPWERFGAVSRSAIIDKVGGDIVGAALPKPWVAVIAADDGAVIAPLVDIDLTGNRAWFNGALRPLGDILTLNNDGSRSFTAEAMAAVTAAITAASGYAFAAEHQTPDFFGTGSQPAGTLFSATSGAPNSLRLRAITGSDVTNFAPGGNTNVDVDLRGTGYQVGVRSANTRGQGIHRSSISVGSDGTLRTLYDAGYRFQGSFPGANWFVPTGMEIGRRAAFGDMLAQNITVRRVTLYPRAMSHAELARVGEFTEHRYAPLLIEGDSYNNLGHAAEAILMALSPLGYVPSVADGEGGRGLNWHAGKLAAMIAAEPKFARYTQVLMEGGLDRSSLRYPTSDNVNEGPFSDLQLLQYARTMRSLFANPSWVWLAGNENQAAIGTAQDRADLQAFYGKAAATYPDAWCNWNTLVRAQAKAQGPYGTDSAAYEAYRTTGLLPPHLMADAVHLNWWDASTPGPGGHYWLGKAAAAKLATLGYALRT